MCVWLTNPSIVSVFKHASQVQPGQKEKDASEKERRTTLFYFPHDTKKPNLLKNLILFFFCGELMYVFEDESHIF